MVKLVDLLADVDVETPSAISLGQRLNDQKEYEKLLKSNPNSIVLLNAISFGISSDKEATENPEKFRAWSNLLKLLFEEFCSDPYWNSRIGWLMWFWVGYARYDSYYPMGWAYHYDPLNWYRSDEPMRPDGLERVSPDDPMNVRGKCFVHPEWYKIKEETGKANWNEVNEPTDR